MTFAFRVAAFTAAVIVFALPVWANNPPRPDGVLYLILVFPLIATAAHLAGVVIEKPSGAVRFGRGVFFTFLILGSAATMGMGLVAMAVIVFYGVARAIHIAVEGKSRASWAYALVVALGCIAAGCGYVWAAYSTSAPVMNRGYQKRTMADMRTLGTAIVQWSADQREAEATAAAARTVTATASANPDAVAEGGAALPDRDKISFAEGQGPPPISSDELEELLVPDYLRQLVFEDGWREPFDVRLDRETHRFQIRSRGWDGGWDGDEYKPGPFPPRQYHQDIVYADGEFVCWPEAIEER